MLPLVSTYLRMYVLYIYPINFATVMLLYNVISITFLLYCHDSSVLTVYCTIGISTCTVREELDQHVTPEISTPTGDNPLTEKHQRNNNPAQGKL